MKLKLPSSLTSNSGHHGIEKAASDDMSCSSDSSNSNSNRSVLSLLSSRSKSKSKSRARTSRARSRSISFRDTNTFSADPMRKPTAPTKKLMSPRKKIMKRFQRSFSSSPSNSGDQSNSQQDDGIDSSCSDSATDLEKENALASVHDSRASSADSDLCSIDSAILSIANHAVAVNFPSSSYIRPVPIKREDNINTIDVRTDAGETKPTRTARPPIPDEKDVRTSSDQESDDPGIHDDGAAERAKQPANHGRKEGEIGGAQKPADACDRRSLSETESPIGLVTRGSGTDEIEKAVEQDASHKTAPKPGEVLVVTATIGETIDDIEADHSDVEIKEDNVSPTSATTTESLLPPLEEDDEESQKLLLPAIEPKAIERSTNSEPEEHPKPPGIKACAHAIEVQANPKVLSSSCVQQTYVTSPLSESSFGQSRNGWSSDEEEFSVSVAKSSLVLDYRGDDGSSNDPVSNLTKSAFEPPREVVTITLGPVMAAQNPFEQPSSKIPTVDPAIAGQNDECEKENKGRHRRKSKRRKDGNETSDKTRKPTTPPREDTVDDDDEKRMAQELAVRLGKDLESKREETEKYASKNRRLESKLQILKAQQDEHMVHRGRLVKACLYTAPVFVLCGGLDAFLATILLVWVLVEVDGYLEGGEGHDDDEEDGDDDDDDEDGLSNGGSESDDGFGDDGSSMDL